MVFEPVDPRVRFPALEERILAFWKDASVFDRSVDARRGGPEWVFYEGPPTANARPGIHHVEARAFKDLYPRFKTMTGHHVVRRGGWDCHGLPVEVEVEKEIGTTGKRDIEAFGVDRFAELCRASVRRYVADWERLTERIGFWIDLSDAYWTMDTEYVESVWWSLKGLFERGLLVRDDRITTYCPRCGTSLSDAEVALGYETVRDPSIFVRFPIDSSPGDRSLEGASLVGWTTTPWTLPSNEGLAVDRGATYAELEVDDERLIVAADRVDDVAPTGRVVRRLPGQALVGLRYSPPFPNVDDAHLVVHGDFVDLSTGTGVVHLAPAFGPDDLAVGRSEGWPLFQPVDDAGRFTDEAPEFVRGRFVKDADPEIVRELAERGLVLRADEVEHAYPFCWRCQTVLLYVARPSWYVRTTAVKDRLLEVNDEVHWYPDHIRRGRYGNWLENNVDWALSRERYWGTPLPLWRCGHDHVRAIGSLAELGDLAGRDLSEMDPHRPWIDDVTFACPECGSVSHRVPEVIDTWYDSGAMPFAQWGYHPDLGRGAEAFEGAFPADFISEAIDQTRGWFYTLMAEAVLHFDATAYRNVVCLGHIVAADGRKMSKSLGNTFDPWDALERQGADALRWFMITSGSPSESRRIGHEILDEVVRRFFLPLWNVYAFFVTYANAEGFEPWNAATGAARTELDRWILSRLEGTVRAARDGLDAYDATGAGRAIASFVDDLSGWYVRRSRRRFWNPGGQGDADARVAFDTLHRCLVVVAQLIAPMTPFVADEIWRNLAAGRDGRPESVHLTDYPQPVEAELDDGLEEAMATARAVVELGRRVRVETKTKTRQPLVEAVVHVPGARDALVPLLPIVAEELNVREVRFAESEGAFGRWRAKPNYRALGPRLGPSVREVASALDADDGSVAGALARGERRTVVGVDLAPDDVDLVQEVLEGWGVASESGVTVALDLELDDDLRREGMARDLIRVIQDLRKAAGLAVTQRIELGVVATGAPAAALEAHREDVAGETLAVRIGGVAIDGPAARAEIGGEEVEVSLRPA